MADWMVAGLLAGIVMLGGAIGVAGALWTPAARRVRRDDRGCGAERAREAGPGEAVRYGAEPLGR